MKSCYSYFSVLSNSLLNTLEIRFLICNFPKLFLHRNFKIGYTFLHLSRICRNALPQYGSVTEIQWLDLLIENGEILSLDVEKFVGYLWVGLWNLFWKNAGAIWDWLFKTLSWILLSWNRSAATTLLLQICKANRNNFKNCFRNTLRIL